MKAREVVFSQVPWLLMILVAALQVPAFVLPPTSFFHAALPEGTRLPLLSAAKLFGLYLATYAASQCVGGLPRGEPTRRPWLLLGGGMGAFAIAQTILVVYQLVLEIPTPFPSLADAFFIPGTVMLAAGLVGVIRVYLASGMALPQGRTVVLLTLGVLASALALGTFVLAPIVLAPVPLFERVLNVAYPVLDLFALIPTLAMLRLTWALRGGSLFRAWALVLAGIIASALGDVSFAYFSSRDIDILDPLVHLAFTWSYLLLGWGLHTHATILRDD